MNDKDKATRTFDVIFCTDRHATTSQHSSTDDTLE